MKKYDVIVVGGGAAGLACAVALSQSGNIKVLVIEAGARAGKKLSATGNGQGNIGNMDMSSEHYRSGNLNIVADIAVRGSAADSVRSRIFGPMLYKCDSVGRIYPQSLQASSLTDILLRRLSDGGAELLLSAKVTNIKKGFIVYCGDRQFDTDFVVLATGGRAQKQYMTDGSSYKLAQAFGHSVTPLYPAIVQLKTDTRYIKGLKGIRVNCAARAYVDGILKKETVADIIFTEYGVSGNAAFYLSSALSARGGILEIDFLPDYSKESIVKVLKDRLGGGTSYPDVLCGIVHNQIARAVIARAGECDVNKIAALLKNFTLEVIGTLGFDYAQVTQGGINMGEVTPNLESRFCKNLYFAGEILDVDGDCGGYNLHWAFASGIAVADDIISKLKNKYEADR